MRQDVSFFNVMLMQASENLDDDNDDDDDDDDGDGDGTSSAIAFMVLWSS